MQCMTHRARQYTFGHLLILALLTIAQSARAEQEPFIDAPISFTPAELGEATGCNLMVRSEVERFLHLTIHCQAHAALTNQESIAITPKFQADPPIARRVRFWHKIYTLFTARDYVLHAGNSPETVVEIIRIKDQSIERGLDHQARSYLHQRQRFWQRQLQQLGQQLTVTPNTWPQRHLATVLKHWPNSRQTTAAQLDLRWQRGQRDYIARGIESAAPYLTHIDEIFKSKGLPVELGRIAFVESSFNLNAISNVGASGVYQLMPFVAREMMHVSPTIDERRDPLKAAEAAAKLFQQNQRILNDWPLAITAYNHGPYGLKRALRRTGKKDLFYLIENYDHGSFGFAAQNFYPSFLAILWTLTEASQYFAPLDLTEPLQYQEHQVQQRVRLKRLAQQLKVSPIDLRQLNPDLPGRSHMANPLLPRGYWLKLPLKAEATATKLSDDHVWRSITLAVADEPPPKEKTTAPSAKP